MIESAFEADERKRRQKDAEAALHKSLGVQDEHGRQLHGHERTLAAREQRAALKATQPEPEPPPAPKPPVAENLREQMKAAVSVPPKEAEKKPLAEKRVDDIRVAINAPHKAVCRGGEVALTIAPPVILQQGVDGGSTQITPWQPVPAATANKVIIEPFAKLLGLDLTNYTVADLTTQWTLAEDEVLYLEMAYTAGVLDTVTLIGGATWSGYPDPIEKSGTGTLGDPYIVEKTRFLLAYTRDATDTGSPAGCMSLDDSGTAIKVIRCVFGPLGLIYVTLDGLTFEYPDPPPRIP